MMATTIDSFESNSLSTDGVNVTNKMGEFNKSFDSSVKNDNGIFKNTELSTANTNAMNWLGVENQAILEIPMDSFSGSIKQMYEGVELPNGEKSLGIKEIGMRKGTTYADYKAKAGYAAEVISTTKENLVNEALGNGEKVYRADDLPDLFSKNDQYVDKVRMDANGNVTERIQTKFVGKNGDECFKKLMSKDFDKYFNDGQVDKMEVPKDFYKDVKKNISSERNSYEKQLERVTNEGNVDAQENIQSKIERLNKMDEMLEQSNTTSAEAIQAAKHPKYYAAKQIAKRGTADGLKTAGDAMIITGAISTVDNLSDYMDGNISAEEAVKNVALDTGTAGAVGFSVGFISSSTSAMMASSSNQLIKSLGTAGGGCIPAAAVSYGIEVHDTVLDYAEGTIDNEEFVDELGRSGAKVAGGMVGGAVGSVAGPAGSFVGASIGSEVGVAAYDTVQYVAETSVDLALGETTIEEVTEEVTDAAINKAEEIKGKAVETAENYKEIAEFVAEETGVDEKVSDIKEAVDETIQETKTNIVETSDKIKESAEEKVDEVKDAIEETAEKNVETVKDYQQSAKELVSSTVNYAVTSEAYVTASETLEAGSEELGKLETKAKEYADKAIDKAGDFGSDAVKDVKAAFNDFNLKNSLPFNI